MSASRHPLARPRRAPLHRDRSRRAGFTLVELMVTVLLGSATLAVAAKVGQVLVGSSAKAREVTALADRARLLGRQVRNDIRATGVGSTGAIAVDTSRAPWSVVGRVTPAGFPAIPAVAGVNNLAATNIGGVTLRAGSDAVQLVVTNGATLRRTTRTAQRLATQIFVEDSAGFTCPDGLVLVVDHTSPNGAGRTQLVYMNGAPGPLSFNTFDALQFDLVEGSDVMCARVSTYWVDTDRWLHRSDLTRLGNRTALAGGGPVYVDRTRLQADRLAPGVLDLQLAYRVSSEAYRINGQAIPAGDPDAAWAYDPGGAANGLMGQFRSWFEVRAVRANLLFRTQRRLQANQGNRGVPRLEDGGADLQVDRAHGAEWVTFSEAITSLRYFDLGAPQGVVAEPF